MIVPFIPYSEFKLKNIHQTHSSRVLGTVAPYDVLFTPNSSWLYSLADGREDTVATFTVKNVGSSPIFIDGYNLSSQFRLLTELPTSLFPNQSFSFDIEYFSTEVGNFIGSFSLKSAQDRNNNIAMLRGTYRVDEGWTHIADIDEMLNSLWTFLQASVQPALVENEPVLSLPAITYAFVEEQTEDTTSSFIQVPIQNSGTLPLNISDFTVTGNFSIIP